MRNTTELKGVVIEGGWRNNYGSKSLGFTVTDPISGASLAEIELDEKQIMNLLSNTHAGYVGGEFRLYHSGLSRIGKHHALLDVMVQIPSDSYGKDALPALNRELERAWILTGGFPWEPTIVTSWNSHHSNGFTYRETLHGWFDASETVETISERLVDTDGSLFSNLRVFAQRHGGDL